MPPQPANMTSATGKTKAVPTSLVQTAIPPKPHHGGKT